MRYSPVLLVCVCLFILVLVSVESKSRPSKSDASSKSTKSHKDSPIKKQSRGHRHKDGSSSEEKSHIMKVKKTSKNRNVSGLHGIHRNDSFLHAERLFSSQDMHDRNKNTGKYSLINETSNTIITDDKKRNFTLTSMAKHLNSSKTSENISNLNTGPISSSKHFTNFSYSPQNNTKTTSLNTFNDTSNAINTDDKKRNFTLTSKTTHLNSSKTTGNIPNLNTGPTSSSKHFTNYSYSPQNNTKAKISNTFNGTTFTSNLGRNNFTSKYNRTVPTDFSKRNDPKSTQGYGWNALSNPRGFEPDYSKQFVAPNGNMIPISHSYHSAPYNPPDSSYPLFNPQSKTITKTYPNIGWKINPGQPVNTQINQQFVSSHFVPPAQIGWAPLNPVYSQQQFNHYGSYDGGFSDYVEKKNKKKKKKFKLDLSLEDFSLEDLSLENINWQDIFKGSKNDINDKLKYLLKTKQIDKLPTRRLYSSMFPADFRNITLDDISGKGSMPNFTSKSFLNYIHPPTNPKVFAGLEKEKQMDSLIRRKRDLPPEGKVMVKIINNFLLKERDCNETLDARRRKRETEETSRKIGRSYSSSNGPILQNFRFANIEAIVKGEFEVSVYGGIPPLAPLHANLYEKRREVKTTHKEQSSSDSSKAFQINEHKSVNEKTFNFEGVRKPFLTQIDQKPILNVPASGSYTSEELRVRNDPGLDITGANASPTYGNIFKKGTEDKFPYRGSVTENKASRGITKLTRVHETISQFLGRKPLGVPTKLRPVNGSLEDWKKSANKSLNEQVLLSPEVSVTSTNHDSSDYLLRSTRSLPEAIQIGEMNENKKIHAPNREESSLNDGLQNNRTNSFLKPTIILTNDYVTNFNKDLPYFYSVVTDSKSFSKSKNEILTPADGVDSYVTVESWNDYNGNASMESLENEIIDHTLSDKSKTLKMFEDEDELKISKTISSWNDSDYSETTLDNRKGSFVTPIMQKSAVVEEPIPYKTPSHSLPSATESEVTTAQYERDVPFTTTPTSTATKNIEEIVSEEGKTDNLSGYLETDSDESASEKFSQIDYISSTDEHRPTADYSTEDFRGTDSLEKGHATANNDSRKSKPMETMANKSSIQIHRVRNITEIQLKPIIPTGIIFQKETSSKLLPNGKEVLIQAPLKKLICPKGQRKMKGRCRVIWRG